MEIAHAAEQDAGAPEFDFRMYLRILRKRKWIILAVFTIVVTTVWTHTSKLKPVYKATTRIVIDKDRMNFVSVNEVLQADAGSSEYLETQFQIIKSRSMIHRVIDELDLGNNPEFKPQVSQDFHVKPSDIPRWIVEGIIDTLRTAKNTIIPPEPEPVKPKDPIEEEIANDPDLRQREQFYRKVAARLSVATVRGTRLVDVSFIGSDPVVITKILNKLTEIYVDQNLQTRLYASEDASVWLDERLGGMQAKVEQSERDLQMYSQNLGVVSIEETQQLVNQRASQLSSQVIQARRSRTELETLYKNSQNPKLAESLPELINNPLIQEMNKELSFLGTRQSELQEVYGPKHPKMVQIKSQIANAKTAIDREIRKIHGSIYTQYQVALVSERSLIDALEEQQQEAAFLNEKSIRYGVLKREAASNRQMYDLLLKRLKETDLSLGLRTNNIRVIDPAVPPLGPFKPDKKRNMMMGMIFGLVGGIGLAFLIEFLDNTVKEPDEIALRWGIPFLGLVGAHRISHRKGSKDGESVPIVACNDPNSDIAENLRTIRTNVIFSSEGDRQRTYMVTSSLPGEGKTTTAANLAVIMASLGEKILLVDADLRRPAVHKMFDIDKSNGLSTYLIRQAKFNDVLADSGVANLTVIPSGIPPPNPSELLCHPQMKALIDTAKERFDRVIIDAPPIASVTDPMIISRQVDAVIMVIRCGVAPRDAVTKSLEQLRNVNARLMGAVLNAVDFRKDSYYYQYYYKHKYYQDSESATSKDGVAVS